MTNDDVIFACVYGLIVHSVRPCSDSCFGQRTTGQRADIFDIMVPVTCPHMRHIYGRAFGWKWCIRTWYVYTPSVQVPYRLPLNAERYRQPGLSQDVPGLLSWGYFSTLRALRFKMSFIDDTKPFDPPLSDELQGKERCTRGDRLNLAGFKPE